MKKVIVIISTLFLMALFGCSDRRAEELFETAKLEELQNNRPHALEIYREILSRYPESEYAKLARERLSHLEQSEKK